MFKPLPCMYVSISCFSNLVQILLWDNSLQTLCYFLGLSYVTRQTLSDLQMGKCAKVTINFYELYLFTVLCDRKHSNNNLLSIWKNDKNDNCITFFKKKNTSYLQYHYNWLYIMTSSFKIIIIDSTKFTFCNKLVFLSTFFSFISNQPRTK